MAKKKKTKKQPTFEESLDALEEIVGKLEGGKLPLAESLQQYELGVKHLKSCYALLEDAERRIELVAGVDSQGQAETAPFDEAVGEAPSTDHREARGRRSPGARGNRGDADDPSSLF